MNGEDQETPRGPGMMAVGGALMTGVVALGIGLVLGGVVGWVAKPAEKVEVSVPRELTAEELQAACLPEVQETATKLDEVQNKVNFLTQEVADREARVVELETEMTRRAERGRELVAELEQAKRDLEEARAELAIVRAEKERLVVELTQTQEQLAETEKALTTQKTMTERAKEDALVNKWYRFIHTAQLEVCDKGGRNKLGNCRETVQSALMTNPRRDKFAHCVRSGQATPMVRELSKDESLPDFSEMIEEEERPTKGWYVLFCDPTLPEKTDGMLNEEPLPPTEPEPTPG
jgi:hypothetical protein